MRLTHLFNNTCTQPNATSSYWPSCSQQPNTLSFRSIRCDEAAFKVSNNIAYCNEYSNEQQLSKWSKALSTEEDLLLELEDEEGGPERLERVIRGSLKSDRLFFEPGETNSILSSEAAAKKASRSDITVTEKSDVSLLSMESLDPYLDFKKSMEEMVEAHGVKGWEWLQELLGCYLKVNGKSNHEFIIEAFVDLLASLDLESLGLISSSSSSFVASSSSPIRFSSSDISTSFCSSSNLPTDEVEGCSTFGG